MNIFLCVFNKNNNLNVIAIEAFDIVHAGRELQRLKAIPAIAIVGISKLDNRTTVIPKKIYTYKKENKKVLNES